MIKLRVLDADYSIRLVRGYCTMPNGHESLGLCDADGGRIEVSDTVDPRRRRRILLHELHHAMHAEMRLDDSPLDEEASCEIASRLWIPPIELGRAMAYIRTGRVPASVIWLPGEEWPRVLDEPASVQ